MFHWPIGEPAKRVGKHKLIVTAGMIGVTLVSITWPEMCSHRGVILMGCLTNLVWLWT